MRAFATCHCHPQSLDSASTVEAFTRREVELGSGYLTCTDHGTLAAAYEVVKWAKVKAWPDKTAKPVLTPIIGLEGYVRDDDCPILKHLGVPKTGMMPHGEDAATWKQRYPGGTFLEYNKYYHITLGFRDFKAYRCAVRLLSKADLRAERHGKERKPLFTWDDLEELAAHNVTATSSCLIGMVQRHLLAGGSVGPHAASLYLRRLHHLFKERFYVEVFPHDCSRNWVEQVFVNVVDEAGKEERLRFNWEKWLRCIDEKGATIDLRAQELAARPGQTGLKLVGVRHYYTWTELPPRRVVSAVKVEDFVQNECTALAPDGDVQAMGNRFVLEAARKYDIPVIIGDDSHFASADEKIVQDVRLSQSGAWRFATSYHRMSSEEALALFKAKGMADDKTFEGWVDNTLGWAEGFKGFKLETEVNLPTKFFPKDTLAYTRKLIARHGRDRQDPVYQARRDAEIDMLHRNGKLDLLPYFMVDEEVCRLYKNQGEVPGPGRGCLSADALVLTESGYTPIKEVEVGDYVVTHTGESRRVARTFQYQITEDLVKFKTTYAYSPFLLTKDHKVFAFKRTRLRPSGGVWKARIWKEESMTPAWISADLLERGDVIWVPIPHRNPVEPQPVDLAKFAYKGMEVTEDALTCVVSNRIECSSNQLGPRSFIQRVLRGRFRPVTSNGKTATRALRAMAALLVKLQDRGETLVSWRAKETTRSIPRFLHIDEDIAYFLGRWIGDGWIHNEQRVGVAFHSDDEVGMDRIEKTGQRFCLGVPTRQKHAKKRLIQMMFSSTVFCSWLRELFPDYKNTSESKYIPERFMAWPAYLLRALLEGIVDSDGSKKTGNGLTRTAIDTTSVRLCQGIRRGLLYLGIPSSVYKQKPRRRGVYLCNESYKIRFKWSNESKVGYWVKVMDKEYLQGDVVYDLQVEEHSSFLTSEFTVHNSAAGLYLAYLEGITHVDPIKYELSKDRFITPDRIKSGKLPDIDQDLAHREWLEGFDCDCIEFEAADGTRHIVPEVMRFDTDQGVMTIREAVEKGAELEAWWTLGQDHADQAYNAK